MAVSINDAALCRMILGWSDLEIDWKFRQSGKNMFHRIAQNKGHEIFDLITAHRSEEELCHIREAMNDVLDEPGTTPLYYAMPDVKLGKKLVAFGADLKELDIHNLIRKHNDDKTVSNFLKNK